jgi:hypothetical protein
MVNKDGRYIVSRLVAVDYCDLPATIEEGLDAALLDRRWRPRDQRGRFIPLQVEEPMVWLEPRNDAQAD